MLLNEIEELFKLPSIRLLLAHKGDASVVKFFVHTFRDEQTVFSEDRLSRRLERFLETESITEASDLGTLDHHDTAKRYLKQWTENGFLHLYENEQGDFFYELSQHSEKTLHWLDSLKKQDFIGAESGFKDLVDRLEKLVENTQQDRAKRLDDLYRQKLELERKITALETDEAVPVYEPYEIKSRLHHLILAAKKLLADFKEVEENFKTITQEIYKKQANPQASKANILQFTFDALDELKNSEQGKSFYAFWAFLRTQTQQNHWNELVHNLHQSLEAQNIVYSDDFLKRMEHPLYAVGKKVHEANDKMAKKLSRIIGEREKAEKDVTTELLQSIKTMVLQVVDRDVIPNVSMSVEQEIEFGLPLERSLTLEKQDSKKNYANPQPFKNDISQSAQWAKLSQQQVVDKNLLRKRIEAALEVQSQWELTELIAYLGGIQKGLPEVIGYLTVLKAFHTTVVSQKVESLLFDPAHKKYIEIPHIIVSK